MQNRIHSYEYAMTLAGQIEEKRRLESQLIEEVKKRINISSIKNQQNKILKSYREEWMKSWRSWSLFKDETRENHMDKLKDYIDGLNAYSLIGYLQYLENEIKYANKNNGARYAAELNKMVSNFKDNLDMKSKQLLLSMLDTEIEIERLISKENGHEKYNNELAKLRNYIK